MAVELSYKTKPFGDLLSYPFFFVWISVNIKTDKKIKLALRSWP